MYAVAYFKSPGPIPHAVFPNVFPDFDMALDCVVYQIKSDYSVNVSHADLLEDNSLSGNIVIFWEDTVYVISKLFNFNPKGL